MTTTIRSLCICFRRYRRIFLYHFCHLVLRLLPWSLSKLLPPASIFSGFSTWRWIPGLGGNPPKTTQPSTSAGLGLGRLLRKNPETLGRDRSLDLKVTMPAVFNVYPPKTNLPAALRQDGTAAGPLLTAVLRCKARVALEAVAAGVGISP